VCCYYYSCVHTDHTIYINIIYIFIYVNNKYIGIYHYAVTAVGIYLYSIRTYTFYLIYLYYIRRYVRVILQDDLYAIYIIVISTGRFF